jgi:simple sugar transport system permease protein
MRWWCCSSAPRRPSRVALATGAAIGLANGLLIVGLRIPDLLATLGMMFLLAGLQLIPSAGRSITTGLILADGSVGTRGVRSGVSGDRPLSNYGTWRPLPVVIVAIIAQSSPGSSWSAPAGAASSTPSAATRRRPISPAPGPALPRRAYVISGVLAALGGVFIAARVGRGDVFAGSSLLARQRRRILDRLCRARSAPRQCHRRRHRRDLRRHRAQRSDDAERSLLHAGLSSKAAVLVGALALTFGIGRKSRR